MRVLGDDPEDDDSQLILQGETLLYGNSRGKSLQTPVDVQNHLIVLGMCAELLEGRDRVALLSIDAEKKRPHTAT